MNRRSYLKNILILGAFGSASYPLFKWFDINRPINIAELRGKMNLIAELAELIIPETDTPGARSASVHLYIVNVLINCNSERTQHQFLNGLEDLERYAVKTYKKEFLECGKIEKEAVLQNFADHSEYSSRILNKIHNKILGPTFYSMLHALTVQGYCLSELGATKGLAYDYIPGNYEACIPLRKNQRSWATK